MAAPPPPLRKTLFHPGQRIAVAVSGGADSVALLRRLVEEAPSLGISLSVAHVHHGIRGAEADGDAEFVKALASECGLAFHLKHVDAPTAAAERRETLEEAARLLRYAFLEGLIAQGQADAVVTAHTLDDQAETVLFKLLRGGWTEGLSGIHAVLTVSGGSILRPFLETTRASIEAWLGSIGQPWREDTTNCNLAHTRNRIRHELLPQLSAFNPQIARQLSRLAAISADEERYWQSELDRLLPSLLLPGKPVRGGGRSSSTHPTEASIAIEIARLRQLPPAVARRVLRAAAKQLGVSLDFDHSEHLLALSLQTQPSRPLKHDLPGGITLEWTLRELRLSRGGPRGKSPEPIREYTFPIPGEVAAPEFGVSLRAELVQGTRGCEAVLRNWRAADRVTLRYSRGPKKVKEILDRLGLRGKEREFWPVVEAAGSIVWMQGVEVDAPGFRFIPNPVLENR